MRILGAGDDSLREQMRVFQDTLAELVAAKDAALQAKSGQGRPNAH